MVCCADGRFSLPDPAVSHPIAPVSQRWGSFAAALQVWLPKGNHTQHWFTLDEMGLDLIEREQGYRRESHPRIGFRCLLREQLYSRHSVWLGLKYKSYVKQA